MVLIKWFEEILKSLFLKSVWLDEGHDWRVLLADWAGSLGRLKEVGLCRLEHVLT